MLSTLGSVYWTDAHFGYDREYDCWPHLRHIVRPDGETLYDVSEIKHGAKYTVHFCPNAKEIWAVKVAGLLDHIWDRTEWQVKYSPARVSDGVPTGRGYTIPCDRVLEFGQSLVMPEKLVDRFQQTTNKGQDGIVAEKAFEWLVNESRVFSGIFSGPVRKSGLQDDIAAGIDFWVGSDLPVQVKFDGPGGTVESGNLFFQTHTLPLHKITSWHGYERQRPSPRT